VTLKLSRRNLGKLGTGMLIAAGTQLVTSPTSAIAQGMIGTNGSGLLSPEEFGRLAEKVSNWGRWGADDQLGALNFITPAIVRRALAQAEAGDTVHCGGPIPGMERENLAAASLTLSFGGTPAWQSVDDRLTLEIHGRPGQTHLDALAHIAYRGRGYNDRAFPSSPTNRMPFNGIESVRKGVVGRGVLIDLPRALGKTWLAPEDVLSPDQFSRLLVEQNIKLRSGDILYIRHGTAFAKPTASSRSEAPLAVTGGLSIACAEIIHKAEPALIATDGGLDIVRPQVQRNPIPWHVLCIAMMGVRLIDGAHLENLAQACSRHRKSDFLTIIAPIEIVGGTASPVNPICIF